MTIAQISRLFRSMFFLNIIIAIGAAIFTVNYNLYPDSSLVFHQNFNAISSVIQSVPGNTTVRFSSRLNFHASIIDFIIVGLIVIGIGYFFYQLFGLYQLTKCKEYHRCFGNVTIIFNANIKSPFCFTFLGKAYVQLPYYLLEDMTLFSIALHHEIIHLKSNDDLYNYGISLVNILCWFNPVWQLYKKWFRQMQEYSVDAKASKRFTPRVYAEALLNIAKNCVNHISVEKYLPTNAMFNHKSILTRRVNMLSLNQPHKRNKMISVITSILLLVSTITTATYAASSIKTSKITMEELNNIVSHLPNNTIPVEANREVLNELNAILENPKLRKSYQEGIGRLSKDNSLKAILTKHQVPTDLIAIALVESRGKNLSPRNLNGLNNAGMWQQIPSMAQSYGLTISSTQDDRMDIEKATNASSAYLRDMYQQTQSWPLAIIGYNAGLNRVRQLEKINQSNNLWQLIATPQLGEEIQRYLPTVEAAVILIRYPDLLNS